MSRRDRSHYLGQYRGQVANNVDPLLQGRVQVEVPSVLGAGVVAWALPCTPYAGPDQGWYAIPPVGTQVWVEFERGDPDYPIWAGCFWPSGEVPDGAGLPATKVLKTEGCRITLSDSAGDERITLETAGGVKIELSDAEGGVIRLTAPQIVVNGTMLDVP